MVTALDEAAVMTVDDVAIIMQVSPWTVRSWIRRGQLAVWRRGRVVRVTRKQLAAFIDNPEDVQS